MVNFNSIYTDVDYKAYCKRLYNNRYLWEDLLQEFYIKIFNCKKKFIDETELKKYCFVVIRNLFYQKERKNSALKEIANDNELTDIEDETTEYNELPDIISKHPTLGIDNV